MARLGPIGLNQLLTDIKNWVNSKLSTKSDTAHTHTAYAVKHTYTTAASAAKNWYRIANANTKQVYTGNPIHAEFILTAYNSSYDPGYSERWYVRAMVLGRNANVIIFGGNTAPFSQCRVLYENTLANIDDNDRPAIDIYLNYVLTNGTTKIEIEEVYNQGWTFVADGQLAVSTVPTGFENVAVSIRGNGVERSTYSDIATYLNKPRRDITSNVTLADNNTYRSTTLNCTGTRTITLPSINSNYFWCVIKNFNAEAGIITIHPSTTSVLIDGSNDDIILRPGEFVAIHSRAANSFTIVGDNRKRTCLVGRSGDVGTDTKHWFRIAQKTLTTRYRDAFILLDVFQAASDSNYMGRLCAHVRVDNTIGVVGNKQFTWLYRGTQLSDDDFAMTTIETRGTSVVVDIWCKRTGGYSAFAFVVVSEGFSTDSPDSPAGKWILTRARATVGDLESLDTGFTTVTNPSIVTLANSITGNAGNVTGTVAIANGGTGATTRLNAVKALTNESVGTPTHFLAITTNWDKAGYTTVAQAKTVLGITGDMGSHSDSEYVHKTGNETISGDKTFGNGTLIVDNGTGNNVHGEIKLNGTRPVYINADNSEDGLFANTACGMSIILNDSSKSIHIGGYTTNSSGRKLIKTADKAPYLTLGTQEVGTQILVPENDTADSTFSITSTLKYASGASAKSFTVKFKQGDDGSSGVFPVANNKTDLGLSGNRWKNVYATNYYYGSDNVEFSTKFVTTDTAQTITGVKTLNNDTLVANLGNAYRIANSAGTGYGVFQRVDNVNWYLMVTAQNDALGSWTSARPASMNLSTGVLSINGNAATATEFSANKSVTLTGDVTGTASSKAGWSVATTLANSGVTAGTYGPDADVTGNNNATISVPEITVDSKGRVTSVTNRTLTCKNNTYNVYNKTLTIQKNGTNVATFTSNSNTDVTANITVPTKTSELTNDSNFLTTSSSLNASKLTGTIDIARLPQGALERVITVADQTARFALTTSSIQLGDTVKQLDTGVMYVVVNESKLNSNDGYLEYTAGSASSVPWSGITSKPTEFTPSSHTHTKSEITDFPTNVSAFTNDAGYLTAHQSLSNYVTLNTAQEITNTKTFKDANTVVKRTDIEAGNTLPSADKLARNIFQDKNGKELGSIFYYKNTSGNTGLCLRAGDWFSESEGVYSLNASGTNRRAELVLYTNSSGDCCIQPNGLFSATLKPLSSSVWLGESTKPFGRVYANAFEFCNAGLLPDTDVQTTEAHSIGFYGQNNTPLSYITFQKRPNLEDRVAIRINTTSSTYKSYCFDASCLYPESSNSVDIGSTTNIFKNIYCNNYYKGTTAFGDIVTHNASEFLTSHQSLANYVTLNGAQTISGIKTISTHLRFSSANTRGTAPSANEERDLIDYKDSAGNRISLFETMYYTDKSSKTSIYAYKTTAATGGNIGSIGIGCDASGNVYTYAPTPSSLDNSTKIATTAFVYNTAAKHLSAATNIYVAKVATGNGSGSNTSNYMALADLRTYLATVHMHSSTSNMNGSYNLQILFKAGDSFGDATFDATKMPGVRNLILNTSTGTNSTVDNYSTNSPTFGNINVTGDIVVTMRNLNCTGRISSQHGAYVSIDTYMGISSLMAANYGYLNVAKNMVINVCDAHTDYLFSAVNNGILAMWPGATITINFRQQCYYTRSLFYAASNGTAWIGYSSFKLTGTEPMAVWGGWGTLTGTSETAAATVEKAVTLASGQTFTLATNATAKVKFTVDNTANNPTLNIGGTGAKPIYWNNAPVQATMLMKNITYDVKYNGSQFVIQNAVKRLTNNDFGIFRSNGNYNQTYNSGSWNFTGWTLYYGTGIENSNWRGSHIGNIQQNVSTVNNTFPVLICGTANATANTLIAPYFAKGVKINPSTNVVSASGFDGPLTGDVTGNCSGTSANVTGTVDIANGGTGATTRLNAIKNLTNESVGTPTHFLAITTNYAKAGYTTVAQAKTVLGITGDIVSHNASEFLTNHQSLDNYVTLNSNQTITAIKTITGGNQGKMIFKNPNYTKGDALESSVTISRLYFGNNASYDSSNAVLTTDVTATGISTVELCAINNTASNSNRASLILSYDKSATRPRLVKSWGDFAPYLDNTYTLGNSSSIWKECYSNAYYLGTTAFGDIVTHNASEFLTSHQSLSSCVKNSVTNNQNIKSTGITRGTAPSSAQTFGIGFSDNNNKYIGNVYGQYATDKSTYVGLYAYKGTTTSNGDNASVRVGYDASGNAYTYAPTPATADNSTQIATTAFVKAQGYLTSHQSLANYVTTNTDQSISGIKSHSKHISILGDYIGNEASGNGRSCLYLKANRDTDGKSGLYVTKFRQNVAQGSMGSSDVVFLSHDILENETRTNAGFVESYSNWTNNVPGGMSVYSTIATRNLGTSAKPWTNAYITNLNLNGAAFDPTSIDGIGTTRLLAYFSTNPTDPSLAAGETKSGTSLYTVYWRLESTASVSGNVYTDFQASLVVNKADAKTGTWKLLHNMSQSVTAKAMIGVWVRIA